jgi:hypothetical protein
MQMDEEKQILREIEKQTDEMQTQMAIDLVLTMMSSASLEKIRALDWWPRAKSALETAADVAASWGQMVSKMAKKLSIDATTIATAKEISLIGDQVGIGTSFERFRALCRRDAVFIVAMAQAKRDEQRQAKAQEEKSE